MSRSHHRGPKNAEPMPNVVRLIRQFQQQPGHGGRLACSYGAHDFLFGAPYPGYKQCQRPNCGAVYATPELLATIGGLAGLPSEVEPS